MVNKTRFPYRRSISLTQEMGAYLEGKVQSGEYESISHALRVLINEAIKKEAQ